MRHLLCIAALFLPLPAFADVTVHDAWAPPSLVGSEVGIAYLTLESTQEDALVSVSSPSAKTIELHTHEKDGDVVRMRKLDSVALPEGKSVTLEPRGLHLMLYGLKAPLPDGSSFPLTLHFTHAKPVTVTATVNQQKLLDFLKY